MENRRYYIAYGSNLNIDQMLRRCPTARVTGTAVLRGWRLLFKGSKTGSYLTIEPDSAHSVPVAVWSVTEADERSLDRYEGYPSFYYRKVLPVDITGIRSGKTYRRSAFVYIMHEERPIGIPSREYVRTCADGYRDFGFGLRPLAEALQFSEEAVG